MVIYDSNLFLNLLHLMNDKEFKFARNDASLTFIMNQNVSTVRCVQVLRTAFDLHIPKNKLKRLKIDFSKYPHPVLPIVKTIADALQKRTYQKEMEFNFDNKSCTDECAIALAKALMKGKCKSRLTISLQNISYKGIKALMKALNSGKCPKGISLNINSDKLDYKAIKEIADTIREEKYPEKFRLELICPGNKYAAKLLVPALQTGRSKKGLRIKLLAQENEDVRILAPVYSSRKLSSEFGFEFGDVTQEGALLLHQAIEKSMQEKKLPIGLSVNFFCVSGDYSYSKTKKRINKILKENDESIAALACITLQQGKSQGNEVINQFPQEVLYRIYEYLYLGSAYKLCGDEGTFSKSNIEKDLNVFNKNLTKTFDEIDSLKFNGKFAKLFDVSFNKANAMIEGKKIASYISPDAPTFGFGAYGDFRILHKIDDTYFICIHSNSQKLAIVIYNQKKQDYSYKFTGDKPKQFFPIGARGFVYSTGDKLCTIKIDEKLDLVNHNEITFKVCLSLIHAMSQVYTNVAYNDLLDLSNLSNGLFASLVRELKFCPLTEKCIVSVWDGDANLVQKVVLPEFVQKLTVLPDQKTLVAYGDIDKPTSIWFIDSVTGNRQCIPNPCESDITNILPIDNENLLLESKGQIKLMTIKPYLELRVEDKEQNKVDIEKTSNKIDIEKTSFTKSVHHLFSHAKNKLEKTGHHLILEMMRMGGKR